ncbi:MAG: T9SS type A sorting domain-containing protein [Flavobacteriaceae bacterium]
MKKITTIILTIAVCITAWSQTYHWATPAGGSGNDYVRGFAVHPDGDSWVMATYETSTTFGGFTFTGTSTNVVIAHYNETGNITQAINIPTGGAYSNANYGLDVDQNKNVYTYFVKVASFEMDGVNFPANQPYGIAKINEQGVVQWSLYPDVNYATPCVFKAVKVLDSGKVLFVGNANTGGTFQIGGQTIDNSSATLVYPKAFLMLVDDNGSVEWVRSIPFSENTFAHGVLYSEVYEDNDGNIYTAGYNDAYNPATTIQSVFLAKFDEDGNHLWSRNNIAANWDGNGAYGLHGNGTDRVYLYYKATGVEQDFGEGATVTVGANNYDGYHAVFDDLGTCLSILPFPEYSGASGTNAFIKIEGCLYEDNEDFHLYGTVKGNITLSGGTVLSADTGINNLNTEDALVLHMNNDFSLNEAVLNTGTGGEQCKELYRIGEDQFVFAGDYTGSSHPFFGTFQPEFGPYELPFYGGRDVFVASYTSGGSASVQEITTAEIKLYPNPAKDVFYIETPELSENTSVQLFDLSGKLLLEQKITANQTAIDIQGLNSGVYLVKTTNNQGTSTQKLIVK